MEGLARGVRIPPEQRVGVSNRFQNILGVSGLVTETRVVLNHLLEAEIARSMKSQKEHCATIQPGAVARGGNGGAVLPAKNGSMAPEGVRRHEPNGGNKGSVNVGDDRGRTVTKS